MPTGPGDPGPDDPAWVHLLSEAARQVGSDRPAVLYDGADGDALLADDRLAAQLAAVDPERRGSAAPLAAAGDTTALCAVDSERTGVVLIQSNAGGWGVRHRRARERHLPAQPRHRLLAAAGPPGRVGPGARPPHTLAPALVTTPDGRLRLVLGTMGGDGQPQFLLQLLARALAGRRGPRAGARRRALAAGLGQLRHLGRGGPGTIRIESHASDEWDEGLQARGHDVMRSSQPVDLAFGQAHMIGVGDDGVLDGASDPRAVGGGAAGY